MLLSDVLRSAWSRAARSGGAKVTAGTALIVGGTYIVDCANSFPVGRLRDAAFALALVAFAGGIAVLLVQGLFGREKKAVPRR